MAENLSDEVQYLKMPETQGHARFLIRILILMSLTAIISISGCIKVRDSPAPGCIEYFPKGLAPVGGCFGRHAIVDVRISPEIECLRIQPNNCNGGTFAIVNECEEVVTLMGHWIRPYHYEYAPGEFTYGEYGIEVITTDGEYTVKQAQGNYASVPPEDDEAMTLSGSVGNDTFTLTYVHTGPLC